MWSADDIIIVCRSIVHDSHLTSILCILHRYLVTRFAEYLLQNYGVDPDITWILDCEFMITWIECYLYSCWCSWLSLDALSPHRYGNPPYFTWYVNPRCSSCCYQYFANSSALSLLSFFKPTRTDEFISREAGNINFGRRIVTTQQFATTGSMELIPTEISLSNGASATTRTDPKLVPPAASADQWFIAVKVRRARWKRRLF